MPKAGLHHVAVRCADLEESIRFYCDAFGFDRVHRWSHPPQVRPAAFVATGNGVHVELFGDAEPVPREEVDEVVPHFALVVEDVAAAFASAVAAGAKPIAEPAPFTLEGEPAVDVTLAFVEGPSGERIELYRTTL